jgi:hypothetical protein
LHGCSSCSGEEFLYCVKAACFAGGTRGGGGRACGLRPVPPTTSCRCHADPPQLHGPYLTWTRKVDNKTVTRTLDTTQTDALRPLLDNSRRLRELTTELEALALQQVRDNPTQPDP